MVALGFVKINDYAFFLYSVWQKAKLPDQVTILSYAYLPTKPDRQVWPNNVYTDQNVQNSLKWVFNVYIPDLNFKNIR